MITVTRLRAGGRPLRPQTPSASLRRASSPWLLLLLQPAAAAPAASRRKKCQTNSAAPTSTAPPPAARGTTVARAAKRRRGLQPRWAATTSRAMTCELHHDEGDRRADCPQQDATRAPDYHVARAAPPSPPATARRSSGGRTSRTPPTRRRRGTSRRTASVLDLSSTAYDCELLPRASDGGVRLCLPDGSNGDGGKLLRRRRPLLLPPPSPPPPSPPPSPPPRRRWRRRPRRRPAAAAPPCPSTTSIVGRTDAKAEYDDWCTNLNTNTYVCEDYFTAKPSDGAIRLCVPDGDGNGKCDASDEFYCCRRPRRRRRRRRRARRPRRRPRRRRAAAAEPPPSRRRRRRRLAAAALRADQLQRSPDLATPARSGTGATARWSNDDWSSSYCNGVHAQGPQVVGSVLRVGRRLVRASVPVAAAEPAAEPARRARRRRARRRRNAPRGGVRGRAAFGLLVPREGGLCVPGFSQEFRDEAATTRGGHSRLPPTSAAAYRQQEAETPGGLKCPLCNTVNACVRLRRRRRPSPPGPPPPPSPPPSAAARSAAAAAAAVAASGAAAAPPLRHIR